MYAGLEVSKDASAGAFGVWGNVKVAGCLPAPPYNNRSETSYRSVSCSRAKIKANCPLEHRTPRKPYRPVSITSIRHPGLKFRWCSRNRLLSLAHPEFRNKRKGHHTYNKRSERRRADDGHRSPVAKPTKILKSPLFVWVIPPFDGYYSRGDRLSGSKCATQGLGLNLNCTSDRSPPPLTTETMPADFI